MEESLLALNKGYSVEKEITPAGDITLVSQIDYWPWQDYRNELIPEQTSFVFRPLPFAALPGHSIKILLLQVQHNDGVRALFKRADSKLLLTESGCGEILRETSGLACLIMIFAQYLCRSGNTLITKDLVHSILLWATLKH